MEAKDTVMSDEDIYEAAKPFADDEFFIVDFDRAIAQAQAEISFKAGIKEVVEWVETQLHISKGSNIHTRLWQAKLEEWGISSS